MTRQTKIFIILTICLLAFSLVFLLTARSSTFAALNASDIQKEIGATASKAGVNQTADLTMIGASVIQALLGLVGVIFFILFIYGGFMWMTAAGSEEKITKAKKIIINAIIGLAIVTAAYSITYFIAKALETSP